MNKNEARQPQIFKSGYEKHKLTLFHLPLQHEVWKTPLLRNR